MGYLPLEREPGDVCGDCGDPLYFSACEAEDCPGDGWGCPGCGTGCDMDFVEDGHCAGLLAAETTDVNEDDEDDD